MPGDRVALLGGANDNLRGQAIQIVLDQVAQDRRSSLAVGPNAKGRDGWSAGVGFEAAAVAAAAEKATWLDGAVADLAGRPVQTEVEASADDRSAADAGANGHPDDRVATSSGPKRRLGQDEGARIVDDRRRQANSGFDRSAKGNVEPGGGQIGEKANHVGRRVVEPRNADPNRGDRVMPRAGGVDRSDDQRRHALDHGGRAFGGKGRSTDIRDDPTGFDVDDGRSKVGSPEIDSNTEHLGYSVIRRLKTS